MTPMCTVVPARDMVRGKSGYQLLYFVERQENIKY